MRTLLLSLLFCVSASAQVAGPEVSVNGYVKSDSTTLALVKGPNQSYVTSAGTTLGDYEVRSIAPDGVTFGYKQQTFPVRLRPPAERDLLSVPGAGQDPAHVILSGVPTPYALRLLAGAAHNSLYVFPTAAGKVSVSNSSTSLRGVMNAIAASASMEVTDYAGFTVVAPSNTNPANWTVSGADTLTGKVSFDFHDAELPYVLLILAKESKQSCVVGSDVGGTVTIYTTEPQPIHTLLTLAARGQKDPPSVTVGNGMLVASRLALEGSDAGESGPPIDFSPRDFRPTSAEEVLQAVARKMKLKLVLPPGFRGRAYVHLAHAPALTAARQLLAVNGYRCHVGKGQLVVEKAAR